MLVMPTSTTPASQAMKAWGEPLNAEVTPNRDRPVMTIGSTAARPTPTLRGCICLTPSHSRARNRAKTHLGVWVKICISMVVSPGGQRVVDGWTLPAPTPAENRFATIPPSGGAKCRHKRAKSQKRTRLRYTSLVLPSAGMLTFHTAVLLLPLVWGWLSLSTCQSPGMGSCTVTTTGSFFAFFSTSS